MATTVIRSDALRNRARVMEAATALFAERGLDVSVRDIAERAGVGKATVFRGFPTKDDLIAAVTCRRLDWIARVADEAAGREDAWQAFVDVLQRIAVAQADDVSFLQALARAGSVPEMARARADAGAALERLMRRAIDQGRMRPDASLEDLRILFSGASQALVDRGERDPAAWRRYAGLVARALLREEAPDGR